MEKTSTYVGMDVHKDTIAVAMLSPARVEPVEFVVRNEGKEIGRLARRLKKESAGSLFCVYEAGPTGYTLQRQLKALGISTAVVAPSLIPVKPGDRIKTDRRDARKLAYAARAGMLTEVRSPSEDEEAVRDLCRCREDAVEDLGRARQRLSKILLRRGLLFRGKGKNWSAGHRAWLRTLRFENVATSAVFGDYLAAIEDLENRLSQLTQKLEEVAQTEPYAESVGWLRCFRGIDTVSAMTILAEIHDFQRFKSPRQFMAYLGLVPTEHTSGAQQRRGGITKTGNSHVRRILIEAAWHSRHRPVVSKQLKLRRKGQPSAIIHLADKAMKRLNRRFLHLVLGSKKSPAKAVAAVARELAGFVWAALLFHHLPVSVATNP